MRKIIITLFLSFILIANVNCDDLTKVKINAFEGGQNSFDLADVINPSQGISIQNAVISKKGMISKRKGQQLFGDDISNTPLTGLGTYYSTDTASYLVAASDTSVIRVDSTGTPWVTFNTVWDNYTKLVLHCDGGNGWAIFTDEIAKAVTANGNAQIATAIKKFGTGSGSFGGVIGDYLSVADSDDWNLGTGDFTIDFWVYFNSLTRAGFVEQYISGTSFWAMNYLSSVNQLAMQYYNGSYVFSIICNPTISAGQWYHIELARSGTNGYIFVNGVSVTLTEWINGALPDLATELHIGKTTDGSYYLNGYLDDFRISKGIARHTANFTPQTSAYSGSDLQPLSSGFNTEFVQANAYLFVLNGVNYPGLFDGSTWYPGSPPTVDWASPPIASTGCWLRNYLFLGGNPSHWDWLYFSNNLMPDNFTSTDVIRINTGDGQKINKLEPFKLNELIIYKEKSIYNLDITGTTPLVDWTLQPVSRIIGCVAPRSVVNTGNDHIFLSSTPIAVRTLTRTQYDKLLIDKLSAPIQDIFDATGEIMLNTDCPEKAAAVLYDDKYFLAIPASPSTVNNVVCTYDFVSKAWTIFTGWFPAAWSTFNNNLYYIDAIDGRVVQCYASQYGDLTKGPWATVTASEPSVAYTFSYSTKNIDFDNADNYKQLDALDVTFKSTGNNTATIYINLDNLGWQSIGTVTLSASGEVRKTFQLQSYGEFKKVKVKIEQTGLNEQCELHNLVLYGRIKPWRREP